MILPAQTIRRLKLIEPFCERTEYRGMTYGLGPAGYDVRIAETVTIAAGRLVLASTIERLVIPDDVQAQVCDKSTWARQGISLFNTILDSGWPGYVTLEIINHGETPIEIKAGDPIAQIIFFRLEEPTERPYRGKYYDQQPGPQRAR
jgi:dCTP deaminase